MHCTATRNIQIYGKQNIGHFFVPIQRRHPLNFSLPLRCTFIPKTVIRTGMDFSKRKNFVREICVCGKWKPFLMSRRRFRSGNNTRKERHLSTVGRRKINAYKPLLRPAVVRVITKRVPGTATAGTTHRN
jgi:hypothetical protein